MRRSRRAAITEVFFRGIRMNVHTLIEIEGFLIGLPADRCGWAETGRASVGRVVPIMRVDLMCSYTALYSSFCLAVMYWL